MSRRPTAAVLALSLALPALAARAARAGRAATPSPAQLRAAHLAGRFTLNGVITDASGVPGERRGRQITRTWGFAGPCPTLPCAAVGLFRRRASGVDVTLLRRRSPSTYSGRGRFALPVRCAGRRYPQGLLVPYTITVRVTAVELTPLGVRVRAIRATYVSRSRQNRTPCFIPPAHDAARYAGSLR